MASIQEALAGLVSAIDEHIDQTLAQVNDAGRVILFLPEGMSLYDALVRLACRTNDLAERVSKLEGLLENQGKGS